MDRHKVYFQKSRRRRSRPLKSIWRGDNNNNSGPMEKNEWAWQHHRGIHLSQLDLFLNKTAGVRHPDSRRANGRLVWRTLSSRTSPHICGHSGRGRLPQLEQRSAEEIENESSTLATKLNCPEPPKRHSEHGKMGAFGASVARRLLRKWWPKWSNSGDDVAKSANNAVGANPDGKTVAKFQSKKAVCYRCWWREVDITAVADIAHRNSVEAKYIFGDNGFFKSIFFSFFSIFFCSLRIKAFVAPQTRSIRCPQRWN